MKTLSLDVALRTCAEIGYQHVELTLNSGYPTEPAVFSSEARVAAVKLLSELKLQLPCLMVLISLIADDEAHARSLHTIAKAGELSHELAPTQPPMLETVLGGSPAKWDAQKSMMVDRLADWATAAEKARVEIAIKAHVSSAVNSPERLLWLIEQVPSPAIQLAYDYSHFEVQGIDMEESMRLLIPQTKFIHVKDSTGDVNKFRFLLPGAGRTDYVQYFSLLRRFQYAGPVCVEVSGQVSSQPDYEPIKAAQQCFASLSTAMKAANNE
jgi:inosose dehydratase